MPYIPIIKLESTVEKFFSGSGEDSEREREISKDIVNVLPDISDSLTKISIERISNGDVAKSSMAASMAHMLDSLHDQVVNSDSEFLSGISIKDIKNSIEERLIESGIVELMEDYENKTPEILSSTSDWMDRMLPLITSDHISGNDAHQINSALRSYKEIAVSYMSMPPDSHMQKIGQTPSLEYQDYLNSPEYLKEREKEIMNDPQYVSQADMQNLNYF